MNDSIKQPKEWKPKKNRLKNDEKGGDNIGGKMSLSKRKYVMNYHPIRKNNYDKILEKLTEIIVFGICFEKRTN